MTFVVCVLYVLGHARLHMGFAPVMGAGRRVACPHPELSMTRWVEQAHLAFTESYALFSKLAFIHSKGDVLASICCSFVLLPNVSRTWVEKWRTILGLIKDPLPFIPTVCTKHHCVPCPMLGTEHKTVQQFSIVSGFKTRLGLKMIIMLEKVIGTLRTQHLLPNAGNCLDFWTDIHGPSKGPGTLMKNRCLQQGLSTSVRLTFRVR